MTSNDPPPNRLGCFTQALGSGALTLASVFGVIGFAEKRYDVVALCVIAAAVVFAGIAIAEAILQRP